MLLIIMLSMDCVWFRLIFFFNLYLVFINTMQILVKLLYHFENEIRAKKDVSSLLSKIIVGVFLMD